MNWSGHVAIVGPMASGCRLLRRVINANPHLRGWLDSTHGSQDPAENGIPIPVDAKVIIIMRDRYAVDASRERRWSGKPEYVSYGNSIEGIGMRHPDAYIVKYELLCENPQREIDKIADHLGIPTWSYSKRIYKNKNAKWGKTNQDREE